MAAPLVAITDGSATALALVRWLRTHGVKVSALEARSADDVAHLVEARAPLRRKERVLALSAAPTQADLDGTRALQVAAHWTLDLSPIERRGAAALLEANRAARRPGYEELAELLRLCKTGDLRIERGKRGRPKGANPFSGTGFDVLVAMLLEPGRGWSERELAVAIDRSPSAVHKIFVELRRRSYLTKRRGGSVLLRPELVRDDLVAAWRGAVVERDGIALICPRGKAPKEIVAEHQIEGHRILLAGVSAAQSADGIMESTVTAYADTAALDALREAGCQPSVSGMEDLVVWEPIERGVYYGPETIDGIDATNRVATYLDLAVGLSDRFVEAAGKLWGREA